MKSRRSSLRRPRWLALALHCEYLLPCESSNASLRATHQSTKSFRSCPFRLREFARWLQSETAWPWFLSVVCAGRDGKRQQQTHHEVFDHLVSLLASRECAVQAGPPRSLRCTACDSRHEGLDRPHVHDTPDSDPGDRHSLPGGSHIHRRNPSDPGPSDRVRSLGDCTRTPIARDPVPANRRHGSQALQLPPTT